jgi:4-amino-4-deoxychorismate lyase
MENEQHHWTFASADRIFLGDALFETLKVVAGAPCCAYLHWQRLTQAAQQLGISFSLSYEHWLARLQQQIQQDKLCDGGIKVILSAGSAPRGLAAYGQGAQLRLQTFAFSISTKSLRLVRAPWLRDAANPLYQVKSVNYLEAILARRQALAVGADDALFFNVQQHATETSCANLFLIHQQTLLTPPQSDGVLPGITRARLLAFAQQQNIAYAEVSLTSAMIAQADAAFTTNSLQGIRAIHAIDEINFPVNHPLLTHLSSSFAVC